MKTSSEHRRPSASHEPWRAAGLRKGRRYGISHQAIDRATERRLAGDWRGACAAAGVDVELDLDAVRNEYGTEFTERLLDDLHHLVPDLAKLHMPRSWKGLGLLLPEQPALLSRPGGPNGPWLTLKVEPWYARRSRRPALTVEPAETHPGHYLEAGRYEYPALHRYNLSSTTAHWEGVPHVWETSRHLWDIRHVHEARERWGGDARRIPFLNPAGGPRALEELPTEDPGAGDPVARAEWIDGLHQAGQVVEAFAAAGIRFDAGPVPMEAAAHLPFSPARIPGELRRLTAAGLGDRFQIPYDKDFLVVFSMDGGVVRAGFVDLDVDTSEITAMPEVCWTRPPDIDVLRDGMSPDELHPLVRAAVAPGHAPGEPPAPVFVDRAPARIRCRGEWHEVTPTRTGIRIPHSDEEILREASLKVLGGRSSGCFAVRETWATGAGRLPRELRRRRDNLFEHVRHGDTDAVLRYLDEEGDPHIRSAGGQTLLHYLSLLDHRVLLPRLLEAGADVNAEDLDGRAALRFVSGRLRGDNGENTAVGRALLAAGAVAELPFPGRPVGVDGSEFSDSPPF
ncbi:ankyrin repeat domain-containing protein [Nocardiopsis changdeensis]|uniref:Ankyrin repeat domain-containing protein n=1 Tax=Nocardiopsis changdeensis TaxID=2831969 RepID=A0ABX8BMJ5_9ACTN|nr:MULTISPECIES: hypothetical protein [Nocardiopsis]QUX23289.1 hypothetical protein KGD84_02510 [Nocardiopsis changdeensis]QYX39231.1 hypothetical protein K1J57_11960 [Nocardiopsis sp. MT53]